MRNIHIIDSTTKDSVVFPSRSKLRFLRWQCFFYTRNIQRILTFSGLVAFTVIYCFILWFQRVGKIEITTSIDGKGSKQAAIEELLTTTIQPVTQAKDSVCHIPRLTPGGPGNMAFKLSEMEVDSSFTYSCINNPWTLFTIDYESNLIRHRRDELDFWNSSTCYYSQVIRIPDKPDFEYENITEMYEIDRWKLKLPPHIEHIHVQCLSKTATSWNMTTNDSSRAIVYQDYLSTVQIKPELESQLQNLPANSGKEYYSVMVIGQDSSSHMNFRRYMPQSHEFLVKDLGAIEFHGFNSLGPGTLWSLFPLYTGLDFREYVSACWQNHSYHDDCPLIWREFARQGYRTAYDEDALEMGIFNDGGKGKGFKAQPFHYDFRTVSYFLHDVVKGHHLRDKARAACYGSRLSFSVLLENSIRVATTFKNKPYWSFTWSQSLTHNKNAYSRFGDEPLASSLKYLHEQQLLNDTILILLSDHGMRYGSFRIFTHQGFLEERLPLLYIVLPQKFEEKYPLATQNLRRNAEKLTTTFDIYEMLRDVLNLTSITNENVLKRSLDSKRSAQRNTSLFLTINPQRTCDMIGFNTIYCSCLSRQPLPANSFLAVRVGKSLLEAINHRLRYHKQCYQLKLVNITKCVKVDYQISIKDEMDRFNMSKGEANALKHDVYEVEIETKPGNGVFYASVVHETLDNSVDVGEITRLSMYGQDGSCMGIKDLRPFCYCKKHSLGKSGDHTSKTISG